MALFDQKDVTCIICGDTVRRCVTAKLNVCGETCRNKFYRRQKKQLKELGDTILLESQE